METNLEMIIEALNKDIAKSEQKNGFFTVTFTDGSEIAFNVIYYTSLNELIVEKDAEIAVAQSVLNDIQDKKIELEAKLEYVNNLSQTAAQ